MKLDSVRNVIGRVLLPVIVVSIGASIAEAARLATPRWDDVSGLSDRPYARKHHTFVYDSYAKQAIMWSGERDTTLFDADSIWTLDLRTFRWARHATSGTKPAARHGHSAVMLPEQRRMIVLMGSTAAGVDNRAQAAAATNEVYELNLDSYAWSKITPGGTGPNCTRWHSAAVSYGQTTFPAKLFMFGGISNLGNPLTAGFQQNDTWALSQSAGGWTWQQAGASVCSGPDQSRPDRRYKHTFIVGRGVGETSDNLYNFGGSYFDDEISNNGFRATVSGTSVTWGGEAYTDASGQDYSRIEHSAIFDRDSSRMIIFGGFKNQQNTQALAAPFAMKIPGLGAPSWTPLATDPAPDGSRPAARMGHAAIYDSEFDRMILFGGVDASEVPMNDTWVLSFRDNPVVSSITNLGIDWHGAQDATIGWTHSGSSAGPASDVYKFDVRWSSSPITTDAEFNAATELSPSFVYTQPNGVWHVAATFSVSSPGAFRYYAVRPIPHALRSVAISNTICFKLTPFLQCGGEEFAMSPSRESRSQLSLAIPNPAPGTFECSFTLPRGEAATLDVIDLAGRRLEHHDLGASATENGSRRLGVTRPLTPGFYVVVLRQGATRIERSVIVRP